MAIVCKNTFTKITRLAKAMKILLCMIIITSTVCVANANLSCRLLLSASHKSSSLRKSILRINLNAPSTVLLQRIELFNEALEDPLIFRNLFSDLVIAGDRGLLSYALESSHLIKPDVLRSEAFIRFVKNVLKHDLLYIRLSHKKDLRLSKIANIYVDMIGYLIPFLSSDLTFSLNLRDFIMKTKVALKLAPFYKLLPEDWKRILDYQWLVPEVPSVVMENARLISREDSDSYSLLDTGLCCEMEGQHRSALIKYSEGATNQTTLIFVDEQLIGSLKSIQRGDSTLLILGNVYDSRGRLIFTPGMVYQIPSLLSKMIVNTERRQNDERWNNRETELPSIAQISNDTEFSLLAGRAIAPLAQNGGTEWEKAILELRALALKKPKSRGNIGGISLR